MTELRPFQLEDVREIYRFRGRVLLASEMGVGKTLIALYWLLKVPKRRPAVIVCPASMKYTWQAEAAMHFGLRAEVLEGKVKGKHKKPLPGPIVIINYDILKSWLPSLLKAKPEVVIFDEAHFIQSITAQRTKAVWKLVEGASSVLALSGTPLTGRPIQLWPILKAVRPDIFPDRYKFAFRHCRPKLTPWGWRFDGADRLPELNRILKRECMIRRLKKDVLKELPDKIHRVVSFRLSDYTEYNSAQRDFLLWLRKLSPSRAERAKKSQALTKVGYLLRLTARLKLEWTERWIADFFEAHPGEKLVCFSMHTFVLDHLAERFRSKAVILDGRVTGRKRTETVRKFQSNRQVQLLLGNWIAAGVGITLHASCNAVAMDLPWTPGDMLQGADRVHRLGQKRKVVIHYLTALNTIEEKQILILRRKSKILDAVLNGEASADDLNVFDELLNEIKLSTVENNLQRNGSIV